MNTTTITLDRHERTLVHLKRLIYAIQAVRARTGLGLRDAKAVVDQYRDTMDSGDADEQTGPEPCFCNQCESFRMGDEHARKPNPPQAVDAPAPRTYADKADLIESEDHIRQRARAVKRTYATAMAKLAKQVLMVRHAYEYTAILNDLCD